MQRKGMRNSLKKSFRFGRSRMKEGLGNHGKRAQMKTLTRLAVRWNAGKTGERRRTRFVSPHKRKI